MPTRDSGLILILLGRLSHHRSSCLTHPALCATCTVVCFLQILRVGCFAVSCSSCLSGSSFSSLFDAAKGLIPAWVYSTFLPQKHSLQRPEAPSLAPLVVRLLGLSASAERYHSCTSQTPPLPAWGRCHIPHLFVRGKRRHVDTVRCSVGLQWTDGSGHVHRNYWLMVWDSSMGTGASHLLTVCTLVQASRRK
jgi:hypothetical protein